MVADFVDKERIAPEFEGLAAVRLQRKGAPDAADAALAESGGLGGGTGGPVGGGGGLSFQSARQHAFDLGVGQAAACRDEVHRAIRRGGDGQSAAALHTLAPVTCRRRDTSVLLSPVTQSSTMRARKARACAVLGRRAHSERLPFGSKQSERREGTTQGHAVPPTYIKCRKSRYLLNEY